MAQGRIINQKIVRSDKVSDLPVEGQLLYTWLTPFADDFGVLQASPKAIKAEVVPLVEVLTFKRIDEMMQLMVQSGLVQEFTYQEKKYYHIDKFEFHQVLKMDRNPQTIVPVPYRFDNKNHKDHWKLVAEHLVESGIHLSIEKYGIQMETETSSVDSSRVPVGIQLDTERKGKEEKRKEGVVGETEDLPVEEKNSKNALVACTEKEIWDIAMLKNVSLKAVKDKHAQILAMIESGEFQKKYKAHKTVYHTLSKWVSMSKDDGRKGYEELDQMGRMNLEHDNPDEVKRRREIAQRAYQKGLI